MAPVTKGNPGGGGGTAPVIKGIPGGGGGGGGIPKPYGSGGAPMGGNPIGTGGGGIGPPEDNGGYDPGYCVGRLGKGGTRAAYQPPQSDRHTYLQYLHGGAASCPGGGPSGIGMSSSLSTCSEPGGGPSGIAISSSASSA